jgi:hypothetical protein
VFHPQSSGKHYKSSGTRAILIFSSMGYRSVTNVNIRRAVKACFEHCGVFLVLLSLIISYALIFHRQNSSIFHSIRASNSSIAFRLVQPRYNSSNFVRNLEMEVVGIQNRRVFEDIIHPTEREFSELFDYFHPEKINILANGDIAFDEGIKAVSVIDSETVFALARYEMSGKLYHVNYSQDVWILRGRLKPELIQNKSRLSFMMGTFNCDNRLAWELNSYGYNVFNPSLTIKTWHIHGSQVRTYSKKDRVPPPYLRLPPISLQDAVLKMNMSKTTRLVG